MKILILGHARHGKDTVAELLVKYMPHLSFTSSSLFAAERVPKLVELSKNYTSTIAMFEDRHGCREFWRKAIVEYNTPDKGRLCSEILEEHDIYVGMRDKEEYEATKHLFDHIIYVDANPRITSVEATMNIEYDEDTMTGIINGGTLNQLDYLVDRFSKYIMFATLTED